MIAVQIRWCRNNQNDLTMIAQWETYYFISVSVRPKQDFIALIHPIQWTIANPVGVDRQKKTSYVSTGWPVPSTSALARWRVILPSCLDRVTASFSFGTN